MDRHGTTDISKLGNFRFFFTHSSLVTIRQLMKGCLQIKEACLSITKYHSPSKLFVSLLASTLLASCAHVKRDGPPNFYVDETRVPNATPKAEPLARYGNMPAYNIAGKRYRVMKTSKNYSAVGVASWYGTMFHARRTSSGERYNMLAMTAAHKSLPLPTYVRVTNLKNHREIIVKVNDRGPFKQNRIIDLSYVAAKKLGMLGRGTAPVRVTAIDPYQYDHPTMMAGPTSKHHIIKRTVTAVKHISRKSKSVQLSKLKTARKRIREI